jgi:hypothetical protein
VKPYLILTLTLLTSCAPMWGGKTGRFASTGATCTITAPVIARHIATARSYRYNLQGLPVPNKVAIGVEECYLTTGMRVKITDMGYLTGQKAVWNEEKFCGGDVPVEALNSCEGGLSATEIAFPFTQKLPVIQRR